MTTAADSSKGLRLGTRGSQLARWQADWVAGELRAAGHRVDLVTIRTTGDAHQSGPISEIAGPRGAPQGVFTKELQRALLAEEIDFAVHSLKDLPTTPVEGLSIVAFPSRGPFGDALISHVADSIDSLPEGARVGTGSFRRQSQLLNRRPDLVVSDLRGNVETRLRKLDEGEHDAIILAQAGLDRLGLDSRIAQRIPPEVMLPAPGQGALGIECRAEDDRTASALAPLDDPITRAAVTAERTALARLEGGCLAALGAWARPTGEGLLLSVVVLSEEGHSRLDAQGSAPVAEAADLGRHVADDLLAQGARDLLRPRA